MAVPFKTSGLRLNNPGNIRQTSIKWIGMTGFVRGRAFARFTTPEFGVRALARIILVDLLKPGATIDKLIREYCPSLDVGGDEPEEVVCAYVHNVCCAVGIGKDRSLPTFNLQFVAKIVNAIIKQEIGYAPFTLEFVKACTVCATETNVGEMEKFFNLDQITLTKTFDNARNEAFEKGRWN